MYAPMAWKNCTWSTTSHKMSKVSMDPIKWIHQKKHRIQIIDAIRIPRTLHCLVTLCVVRRGRRVRLLRRWRVDRVRRWRRLRVVLHPGRRSRLGDPDRRLRKRPGAARREPEGAVLVLRLRRRRRRVPVGGGGGVRPAGLPVGVRHLAAHGWTGSCGGKGLLGLGNWRAEVGRGRGEEGKRRGRPRAGDVGFGAFSQGSGSSKNSSGFGSSDGAASLVELEPF